MISRLIITFIAIVTLYLGTKLFLEAMYLFQLASNLK
jgi:hypothetical protein